MKYLIFALWGLLLAVTSASAQDVYRIQPGDTIAIEVLEDTSLNRSLLVLPDGTINFPFAGTVQAGGRTAAQVQQRIAAGIAPNFATSPTVFVSVNSVSAPRVGEAVVGPDAINVYFLGEVSNAGIRAMASGTTFLQGIAQSGGFSRFAATKRIQLRRTNPLTGEASIITINYRALQDGAQFNQNIILQDGDVILVPERRLFE